MKRFTVLRRVVGGDYDIVCSLYGEAGKVTLLIRDALIPENPFFGVFEPFNSLELEFTQKGNIAIPLDVSLVRRRCLSALDYNRFVWMSHVSLFFLKYVSFYDGRLYELLESNLDKSGSFFINSLLLRLEFLNLFGVKPKFLTQRVPYRGRVRVDVSDGKVSRKGELEVKASVLRVLQSLFAPEGRKTRNIKLSRDIFKEAEIFLDKYIEHHTR